MLLALDLDGIIALMKQVGSPLPSSREVALIAMHEARTGATSLPMKARAESKAWLIGHGYKPWDDGDVPGDMQ